MVAEVAAVALSTIANLWDTYEALKAGWYAVGGHRLTRPTRSPSWDEFNYVRQQQKTKRRAFAEIAHQLPRHAGGRGSFLHAPLLCQDAWIPTEPIPLAVPKDQLEDDSAQLVTTRAKKQLPASANHVRDSVGFSNRARDLLPLQNDQAEPFRHFHDAIQAIERPPEELFVSRPSYSLAKISSGRTHKLSFAEATYFDYVDCGEMLAFELTLELLHLDERHDREEGSTLLARLDESLLLRSHAGEWNAISFRPSLAGVNTLTIFLDRDGHTSSFPMMSRSMKLGSAMGTLHVIPAGEFQPTTDSPVAWETHCTLWQTILREFAEELLLDDEAKSSGLDMQELAGREKIRPLVELIRAGDWKSYYLGVALDPLTLKPEILTVSLIERRRFADALGGFLHESKLPEKNAEGRIQRGPAGWGELLNKRNLATYRDDATTLPAGSGCIELVLRRAGDLLPGLL